MVQLSCNRSSFETLAASFFELCPKGSRRDAEDLGRGLRSVVGIPGGLRSPLMAELQRLKPKEVGFIEGMGSDEDNLHQETIYVYDSTKFRAFLAEEFLQFEDDMSEVYRSAVPALEQAEQKGSAFLCPGPETYTPWSAIAGFLVAAAIVIYVVRFCYKLDWPFRGQSSLKSGPLGVSRMQILLWKRALYQPSCDRE